jgi:glycosyltransferase involved in cell wall biosynthesis
MKLLIIGTDRKLFDPKSAVRQRIAGYGALAQEIHVIVYAQKRAHYKNEQISENVFVYPTSSLSRFFYLWDAWMLGRSIVRGRGKEWIVSAQDPFECGIVAYALARHLNLPLHLQVHTDPFSVAWRRASFVNVFWYVVGVFLLTRASAVRVVSERVRRGVVALGVPSERVTVVPIYVHTTMPAGRTNLSEDYPGYHSFILSVGRLEREKNFSSLLQAFRDVHKRREDTMLILIGSGKEERHLMSLSEQLGIASHVTFLPWSHDVSRYLRGADCYVQPSLYEGWGMAVIEAMAAGAPVVMTDVGCAGEIVIHEKSGLIVSVNDHVALANAILRILEDRALSDRLRSGAYDAIRQLPSAERTLELYKESWEKAIKK